MCSEFSLWELSLALQLPMSCILFEQNFYHSPVSLYCLAFKAIQGRAYPLIYRASSQLIHFYLKASNHNTNQTVQWNPLCPAWCKYQCSGILTRKFKTKNLKDWPVATQQDRSKNRSQMFLTCSPSCSPIQPAPMWTLKDMTLQKFCAA